MSTQFSSKLTRLLQLGVWLLALPVIVGWFGWHSLQAANPAPGISIVTAPPIQAAGASGHAIGDKVTFVFTITNPTADWLSVLPISATFDSTYLAWVSGQPTPTLELDEAIRWEDLTEILGDIPPGQDTPMTITFQTLSTTVHLPDSMTLIHIQIKDEKADPDGPGPLPGDLTLPEVTYDLAVVVDDIPGPPAIPLGIERSPDTVTVAWQTGDESNILGFNLIRTYESGAHEQVNPSLIVAEYAGDPQGATYAIVDPGYKLLEAVTYELQVELIDNETPITAEMGILEPVSIIVDPTSVELTNQGVTPKWETVDETYIKGFDLLRYELPAQAIIDAPQVGTEEPTTIQLNNALIPATASGQASGNPYLFADHSTRIGGGGGYGYKLRIILRNGESLVIDVGTQDPVEITLTAEVLSVEENGVTFQWLTFNELVMTGFNLYRSDATHAETLLNRNVIDAKQGGVEMGAQYNYNDWSADPYTSYTYTVEVLLVDGSSIRYELPASPTLKRIFLPTLSR